MNILHKGRNVETRILLQESLPQPPVSQLVLLLSADFGSSVYLLFGAFRELCPPGTAGRLRKPGDGSLAEHARHPDAAVVYPVHLHLSGQPIGQRRLDTRISKCRVANTFLTYQFPLSMWNSGNRGTLFLSSSTRNPFGNCWRLRCRPF